MATPRSSQPLSDYEQGLKAANRVRIRTQMEIGDDTMPETPIDVVDEIAYLRGVFESGGVFDESALSMFNAQQATEMLSNLDIAYTVTPNKNTIILGHANAHDFLGHIYKGVTVMTPKQQQFLDHVGGLVKCRVWRTSPDAIVPFKVRPSDVGFDLVAISQVKNLTTNTILLDTGIRVQVELGYYAEIVPRSSISKSGYMLANSTGIIDPGYTGNLFIALTKVDPNAPDIKLPFRGCQLIIRRQVHADIEIMDDLGSLGSTGRGHGGFGSTGH
jgi:dUTP pyrophosphatase